MGRSVGSAFPSGGASGSVRSRLSCAITLVRDVVGGRSLRLVPSIGRGVGLTRRVVSSCRRRVGVTASDSPSTGVKRGDTSASFRNCGGRLTVARGNLIAKLIIASKRGTSKGCLYSLVRRSEAGNMRIGTVVKSATCSNGSGLRGYSGRGVLLCTELGSAVDGKFEGGRSRFCFGGSTKVCMYPRNRVTCGGTESLRGGSVGGRGLVFFFSIRGYGYYPLRNVYRGVNAGSGACALAVGSGLRRRRLSFRGDSTFHRGSEVQCQVRRGGDRLGGHCNLGGSVDGNLFNVAVRDTSAMFVTGVEGVVERVRGGKTWELPFLQGGDGQRVIG